MFSGWNPKAIERFVARAVRLYEQEQGEPFGSPRLGSYVRRSSYRVDLEPANIFDGDRYCANRAPHKRLKYESIPSILDPPHTRQTLAGHTTLFGSTATMQPDLTPRTASGRCFPPGGSDASSWCRFVRPNSTSKRHSHTLPPSLGRPQFVPSPCGLGTGPIIPDQSRRTRMCARERIERYWGPGFRINWPCGIRNHKR